MKKLPALFCSMLCATIITVIMLSIVGCSDSADESETEIVQAQSKQYNAGQPIPTFKFSLERDIAIQLYEARNEKVRTHTVWRSNSGLIEGDCPSVGYPIPYDVQLTNPVRATGRNSSSLTTIEQPEPNGLYSSKNSIATWVRAVTAEGDEVPLYIESKVTCYPYPVEVDYDTNRVKRIGKPTVTIKSKQPKQQE